MFLNQSMQAVVILACEKHAPAILERLNNGAEGNWFIMPPTSTFLTGYWPNVSSSHSTHGCAIFGFIEREVFALKLSEFASSQLDQGVCPDCAIYDWGVSSLHLDQSSRDPVCKKIVSCRDAVSENYQGRLYFFCSPHCRDEFHLSPEKFVSPQKESPKESPSAS